MQNNIVAPIAFSIAFISYKFNRAGGDTGISRQHDQHQQRYQN